jgi:hypothetical protein
MKAWTALKLAVESWNGISGEDDSVSHESGFFAGKYTGPFSADEILEAILDPGEKDIIDDPENLTDVVGAIYTQTSDGFRKVGVYTTKSILDDDWADIQNEYGEWTYTVNAGHMVTVYDGAGRSVAFLQDDDGSKLADELAEMNEYQIQKALRLYGEC